VFYSISFPHLGKAGNGVKVLQSEHDNHWTHRLFVENADLYLPFLEQAMGRAPQETAKLAEILTEYGVLEKGRVLDVACGIGRHSIPLAQMGYRVTGVDLSPLYVQRAGEYAAAEGVAAKFLEGNMLDVERSLMDEAPFDAIINMFTSHSYYGRNGDLRTFKQLRNLASPGAVLVVLTVNRDCIVRNFSPESMERAGNIRILQQRRLDLEDSVILNTWHFFEGQGEDLKHRLTLDMDHRLYSLHELRATLEEAGWCYQQGLGRQGGDDLQLGPVTIDSNAMWVVARA
jgi:SAM-dependent methyltransferase